MTVARITVNASGMQLDDVGMCIRRQFTAQTGMHRKPRQIIIVITEREWNS